MTEEKLICYFELDRIFTTQWFAERGIAMASHLPVCDDHQKYTLYRSVCALTTDEILDALACPTDQFATGFSILSSQRSLGA